MKLWRFSTDISLPQSERLEAKWLHINLPDLSIQPEWAGNFTNPIGAETEFSGKKLGFVGTIARLRLGAVHVQVHLIRVFLNELAAGINGVSHQQRKHLVGFDSIFQLDLQQYPGTHIHSCFA